MNKLAVLFLSLLLSLSAANTTYASADGSPAECENPDAKSEGNDNTLSHTAPEGTTISGVCIKSGENMFGGASHSGLLGDGAYENGCYSVSGIGTGSVTVTRTGDPSDICQALSHIDVFYGSPESSPTPTPTPSPTPESTPTPTPSPTPTTTTTGGGGGGGGGAAAAPAGAVAGAAAESTQTPTPTPTPTPAGAVLGAEAELPETGLATYWLYTIIVILLTATGLTIWGLRKS
ncbi:hypothetical protein HYU94_02240 [Candidatus Daviesbacteria bacterium]|nr:hypothetical protein [Candidatus Daviesbacteria bacterium]